MQNYCPLDFKTKIGVVSLIFEPYPPYFAKQYNFSICRSDTYYSYYKSVRLQIYEKFLHEYVHALSIFKGSLS